jgi:hypothetical protein
MMRSALPTIQGVIDRRALVNFRIEPSRLDELLPRPLHPQLVSGWAIGGICLIRLKEIRPVGLPGFLGVRSENAAHRIAVEWEENGERRTGVFIPRRDSSSRVNTLLGGRIFPGFHHRADFSVDDGTGLVSIEMRSRDTVTSVSLRARIGERLAAGSVFESVDDISEFFRKDPVGFSPKPDGRLQGLELETFAWSMLPLDVERVASSFFDDARRFPAGSVEFDSALLMRSIGHRWHSREDLYSG